MITSTQVDCQVVSPMVIQGFSNFLGLFQVMTRQTPHVEVALKHESFKIQETHDVRTSLIAR